MRPRTATIQVWKEKTMWHVEIGDPKQSIPTITANHRILDIALVNAIIHWKEEEGLGV